MPSTKELKQRIKGIKNTGKITRAMEMISAVKMRKSVAKVLAIRPYASNALKIFAKVSQAVNQEQGSIFQERPVKNILFVVVTSNRGLCGSFNSQVMRQVKSEIEKLENHDVRPEKIDFVSIGKKGDKMLQRFGGNIIASFPDIIATPSMDMARSIARLVRDEYEGERYDKVMLIYTDYVSPMVQKTRARRLFPISQGALADEVTEMDDLQKSNDEKSSKAGLSAIYTMEPSPEVVLKTLIPRLVEIQLYHAILESSASQEAARMMAMRNATDAAKEMLSDFTLTYNQLRQAKVTQEIAELSAGMAAVEG